MYGGNSIPFSEDASEYDIERFNALSEYYSESGWKNFYQNNFDISMRRFNQAWLYNPKNPLVYWGFAVIMAERAKHGQPLENLSDAISFFEKAISIIHDNGSLYIDTAIALVSLKCAEYQKNVFSNNNDYIDSLILKAKKYSPNLPVVWLRSAEIACAMELPIEALSSFQKAIELKPDFPEAINSYAWFLSTYPDDTIRDGKLAVELALQAIIITGPMSILCNTLAAAYAENNDFKKAIKFQKKAIYLQNKTDTKSWLMQRMKENLVMYESGKPVRSDPCSFVFPYPISN